MYIKFSYPKAQSVWRLVTRWTCEVSVKPRIFASVINTDSVAHPASNEVGMVKLPCCEVDHSVPANAKFKRTLVYTGTSHASSWSSV